MVIIPKIEQGKKDISLDYLGSSLLVISIASFILLSKSDAAGSMIGFGVLFAIAFLLFVLCEKAAKNPIINLSLFKDSMFMASNLLITFNNLVMYAILYITPLLMSLRFQINEALSGLSLSLFYISLSVSSFVVGKIHHKFGVRKLVFYSFIGLGVVNIGFWIASIISYFILYLIFLVLGGIAIGIAMPSMQMASLSSVDAKMTGSVSGIFSTFRYFGGIVSSVLIAAISGYQYLFIILVVVSFFCTAISRFYNKAK